VWVAAGTSFALGVFITAAASRRRWQDARVWSAFAAGGLVFLGVQFGARPVGALAGQLSGGGDLPAWAVVAVVAVFAEVFKLTAALVLHQVYRLPPADGARLGAAVGAGFGAWSEAVVLRAAQQVAQLGLPGGVSWASVVVASAARLLAGAGSTGIASRLAAHGRPWAGLAAACGAQLLLDPVLRMAVRQPGWVLLCTALLGGGLFAALWVPERGGRMRCR